MTRRALCFRPLVKEEHETEFHAGFLLNTLGKIEWAAFTEAAASIGLEGLPAEVPAEAEADEAFLRAFHHALLEVHVKEVGAYIRPLSGSNASHHNCGITAVVAVAVLADTAHHVINRHCKPSFFE